MPASGHRLPDWVVCLLAFLALLGVYHANGDFLPGHDATPNVYLPLSVLNDGNLTFNAEEAPFMFLWKVQTDDGERYANFLRWEQDPWFRHAYDAGALGVLRERYFLTPTRRDGEYVGLSGIGAGLVAFPAIALLESFTGDLMTKPATLWHAAKTVAALLIAGSAILVYLIARRYEPPLTALLILCAYALGTNVWSTSSQALWQHAPNTFFLTLGAWAWLRVPDARRFAMLSGLCFAIAVMCRPTSAVYVLTALAFLVLVERPALPAFLAGVLPIAAVLAWFNYTYLGSPFIFGQTSAGAAAISIGKTGSPEVWRPASVPLQAAGQLLSPSRGLLVFSPFLAFSFWGAWRIMRDSTLRWQQPLVAGVLGVMLLTAAWVDWWGGWSYGPRLLVDTMPLMAVFLCPVMAWILKERWRLGLFSLLIAWSILAQVVGAFAYDLGGWNNVLAYPVRLEDSDVPVFVGDRAEAEALARARGGTVLDAVRRDIDKPEHRSRLWSVSDNQILHHLKHWSESRENKKQIVDAWLR